MSPSTPASSPGSTSTRADADPLCVCGHRASSHASVDSGDTRCLAVEDRRDLISLFDDGRDHELGYCACLRYTQP